jgi:ATP-dependent Zn protease
MSIVPQARGESIMPWSVRNVLFWSLMVALAIVLWQMSSRGVSGRSVPVISYSAFMDDVSAGSVGTANVKIAQSTADISGDLKAPEGAYRTTVPRDTLSALLDTLRSKGVIVQVSDASQGNFFLGVAPILLLVGFWIYMMRWQMRKRTNPDQQNPTPGAVI